MINIIEQLNEKTEKIDVTLFIKKNIGLPLPPNWYKQHLNVY
jgi:hypothetical protein